MTYEQNIFFERGKIFGELVVMEDLKEKFGQLVYFSIIAALDTN